MTEKRQTSQGYIILILQHFATKLRNITNFAMLFQVVMKFFPDLSISKFHLKGERSIRTRLLRKGYVRTGPSYVRRKVWLVYIVREN